MVSFVSPYRSWQGQEVHPDHRRIPQGRLASQEFPQASPKALNIIFWHGAKRSISFSRAFPSCSRDAPFKYKTFQRIRQLMFYFCACWGQCGSLRSVWSSWKAFLVDAYLPTDCFPCSKEFRDPGTLMQRPCL